jgi:ATP-dependent DNA helicase RecQ
VLLPQIEDRDIRANFPPLGFPREEQVRETLAALAESDRPLSTATLETRVELGRNRLESMLKVLDVDGAVRRVRGGLGVDRAALGVRRGALPPRRRGP